MIYTILLIIFIGLFTMVLLTIREFEIKELETVLDWVEDILIYLTIITIIVGYIEYMIMINT